MNDNNFVIQVNGKDTPGDWRMLLLESDLDYMLEFDKAIVKHLHWQMWRSPHQMKLAISII